MSRYNAELLESIAGSLFRWSRAFYLVAVPLGIGVGWKIGAEIGFPSDEAGFVGCVLVTLFCVFVAVAVANAIVNLLQAASMLAMRTAENDMALSPSSRTDQRLKLAD